ncbi:hypothetical protein [Siminovitchia fortis]|uniref:hypothetical protein n=1 Tax=Siminovitchia fortis TaxID=254758 RepID=UPI0011A8B3C6|nr:hypothetical protein [Siminovitchia fortis]
MTVEELIKELEKMPKYATVRVLRKDNNEVHFYYTGSVKEVILQPIDEDDDYLERYVDIK